MILCLMLPQANIVVISARWEQYVALAGDVPEHLQTTQ